MKTFKKIAFLFGIGIIGTLFSNPSYADYNPQNPFCEKVAPYITDTNRDGSPNLEYMQRKLTKIIQEDDILSTERILCLAKAYESGINIPQHFRKAFILYTEAAERKDPEGLYSLGLFYKKGIVVSIDQNQANDLFKEAALLGHSGGQVEHARFLMQSRNRIQAYAWLNLAFNGSDFRETARKKMNEIIHFLSPSEISQAQDISHDLFVMIRKNKDDQRNSQ